jgi:hypothetical protein
MPSMPSATYQPPTARQHLGDLEMGSLSGATKLPYTATIKGATAGESTLEKSKRKEQG